MTDQKIEEIRARWNDGYKAQSFDRSELGKSMPVMIDIDYLLTELDRLKAVLDRYRYAVAFASADSWDFGTDTRERIKWAKATDDDLLDWSHDKVAEIAAQYHTAKPDAPVRTTLKASGTFSDGVEAAAKLAVDDGGYELAARIRALAKGE